MNGVEVTERFETVVIGGGQAGLAVGHDLARRGRSFVILEAATGSASPGESAGPAFGCSRRPATTGCPGCRSRPRPIPFPTKDDVADYLATYAERMNLPIRTGVLVTRLAQADGGDGFVVTAGRRRFEAKEVVVATGAYSTPRIPDLARDLAPSIRQLHSSGFRDASQLAGWRGPRRRRQQFGSGDRPHRVARAQGRAVGAGPREDAPATREQAGSLLRYRVLVLHQPRGHDGYADRAQGVAVRPRPRRAVGAGLAGGSRRCRRRARGPADGRRAGRPAHARRRPGPGRRRTWSGARASGPTSRGSTCPSSATTAGRSRSGASLRAHRASTSWACRSSIPALRPPRWRRQGRALHRGPDRRANGQVRAGRDTRAAVRAG